MSQEVGEITHLPAMDPNFLVHPSRGFVSTVDLWFLFSSQSAPPGGEIFSSEKCLALVKRLDVVQASCLKPHKDVTWAGRLIVEMKSLVGIEDCMKLFLKYLQDFFLYSNP